MKLEQARVIAEQLRDQFMPYCERIEIAGSVRRGRSEPKDLDLVVIPKTTVELDCFDNPIGVRSLFHPEAMELGELKKNGPRHKQIWLPAHEIHVELWIVLPPAQWGVILTLRTGPADFSMWIVTPRHKGGALPSFLKIQDGAVWNGKSALDVPEEQDFFRLLELPFMDPRERKPQLWAPKRDLAPVA